MLQTALGNKLFPHDSICQCKAPAAGKRLLKYVAKPGACACECTPVGRLAPGSPQPWGDDGWVGGGGRLAGGGGGWGEEGGGMELCLITKFVCKPASQAKDE